MRAFVRACVRACVRAYVRERECKIRKEVSEWKVADIKNTHEIAMQWNDGFFANTIYNDRGIINIFSTLINYYLVLLKGSFKNCDRLMSDACKTYEPDTIR